jgi:hypothetical protein
MGAKRDKGVQSAIFILCFSFLIQFIFAILKINSYLWRRNLLVTGKNNKIVYLFLFKKNGKFTKTNTKCNAPRPFRRRDAFHFKNFV